MTQIESDVIRGCFCCGVQFTDAAERDTHFSNPEHQDAWTTWHFGAMQRMGMLDQLCSGSHFDENASSP